MSENASTAPAPVAPDGKKTITTLEALSNFAIKLNDEVKATLDLMDKKFAGGGQSAADFATLWNARLDIWESYFRAYVKASTLDPDGSAIVNEYTKALFAWIALMRPDVQPTGSKDAMPPDWRPPVSHIPLGAPTNFNNPPSTGPGSLPPPPFGWPR